MHYAGVEEPMGEDKDGGEEDKSLVSVPLYICQFIRVASR